MLAVRVDHQRVGVACLERRPHCHESRLPLATVTAQCEESKCRVPEREVLRLGYAGICTAIENDPDRLPVLEDRTGCLRQEGAAIIAGQDDEM